MKRVKLTQGKWALVSDKDFERVSEHSWFASFESRYSKWYARRRVKPAEKARWKTKHLSLHGYVLNLPTCELPPGHVIHHKDDDGLNCQDFNLEVIHEDLNRTGLVHRVKREPAEVGL